MILAWASPFQWKYPKKRMYNYLQKPYTPSCKKKADFEFYVITQSECFSCEFRWHMAGSVMARCQRYCPTDDPALGYSCQFSLGPAVRRHTYHSEVR